MSAYDILTVDDLQDLLGINLEVLNSHSVRVFTEDTLKAWISTAERRVAAMLYSDTDMDKEEPGIRAAVEIMVEGIVSTRLSMFEFVESFLKYADALEQAKALIEQVNKRQMEEDLFESVDSVEYYAFRNM